MFPSPKFQFHETTLPSLSVLVSVKVTVNASLVKVKPAVGGVFSPPEGGGGAPVPSHWLMLS